MTKKRFERIYEDVDVFCRDHNAKGISQLLEKEDYDKIVDLLNELHEENNELKFELEECREHKLFSRRQLEEENEQLKSKNKELKDKYERKDRQLKRTKKDIEKYTDYFMNELNWDCDRIIKEVFR